MKTLTITDAKRNLGRWLTAAGRGEDIGIICGADIIALRKVEVAPVDDYAYAVQEYGVTRAELDRFGQAVDAHIANARREGKLSTVTPEALQAERDEVPDHHRRRSAKTR